MIERIKLYSANKQQALRYGCFSLRNDLINLRQTKSFWFLRIPVHGARGGIKLPIKPHRPFPDKSKLCESKLIKKHGKYIAMLTFEFDAPEIRKPESVLAVDFGERFPATAVLLQNGSVMKARFYGRQVRGIRRHFSWVHKRLQERGLSEVVERIGDRESRSVNDVLHKVSKEIVSLADSANACIVLGDLKGIKNSAKGKGRRFNRIVGNMPHYKLGEMIKYKADMLGIAVITTSEAYTSKLCHICGNEGKRKTQGRFVCPSCGEYNADLNGAINIGKKTERCLGYMPLRGVSCEQALNSCGSHIESPEAHIL